ncbi:MAG: hypothetical protein LBC77_02915 [Spirochaetaceae bacterium]|jgi:hypothetical protein|nr:hypothetical protein [Spirochaetaceae bacterium]
MRRRGIFIFAIIFLSVFMFTGCGIDAVNYLEHVPEGNVVRTMNNHVDINNLPDGPGGSGVIDRVSLDFTSSRIPQIQSTQLVDFYKRFLVYYRIYCSAIRIDSVSETNLSDINPTLASDYNSLKPYTVPANNYAASVGSAFAGRNYWTISSEIPDNNIRRSTQLITPYPENRFFLNDQQLKDPSYLNSNNNADVVSNSSGSTYTWVSMYVVQTSLSTNLTPYYSAPTFLGVFLLPDSF